MGKVIFDSSFLMAVVERPTTWFEDIVDLAGKFEPVLLDCVRAELEKLAEGQEKKSRVARVSLELASKFKGGACGNGSAVDVFVSAALSSTAVVATVDGDLIRSLKAVRVRVVSQSSGRVALAKEPPKIC